MYNKILFTIGQQRPYNYTSIQAFIHKFYIGLLIAITENNITGGIVLNIILITLMGLQWEYNISFDAYYL